jgi:hypothetical protein
MGVDLPSLQARRYRQLCKRIAERRQPLNPSARRVAGQRRAHSNLTGSITEQKGSSTLNTIIDYRPRGLSRQILDGLTGMLGELLRQNAADDCLLADEAQTSERLAAAKQARAAKVAAQAGESDPDMVKAMTKELKNLSATHLELAQALEVIKEARAAIAAELEPLEIKFAEERSMRLGSAVAAHAGDIAADLETRELIKVIIPPLLDLLRKVVSLHGVRHGATLANWLRMLVIPSLTDPNMPLIEGGKTRLHHGQVSTSWHDILEDYDAPPELRVAMEEAAESARIERELRAYMPRAQRLARAKPPAGRGYSHEGIRGDREWVQRAQERDAARGQTEAAATGLDPTQPGAWSSRAAAPAAPPPPALHDDLSRYRDAGEVLDRDARLRGD